MLSEIINIPRSRVLDFLADHVRYDHNMTDISNNANVSRPTLYKLLDELVKEKLIVITRTMGKSKMYQINMENPIIKAMLKADFKVAAEEAEKESKEVKKK